MTAVRSAQWSACLLMLLPTLRAAADQDLSAAAQTPTDGESGAAVQPLHSFLHVDGAVRGAVRAHASENPALRRDWFAKMGGSSVASKAFLHCMATEHVDLGDYGHLDPTLRFFSASGRNAFSRESLAAGRNWNLKYALTGEPPYWRREVQAIRPQWALALFGSNDAQNRNERIYAKRLLKLVDGLLAEGVVPVLGSATPRRKPGKDRWVRRFNRVTYAIARARKLPFIDYYGAMVQLPDKGLARDGTHPNVAGKGGVQRACKFDERGLQYGHHVRNLLTLMMLHELVGAVENGQPGAAVRTQPAATPFPFSELLPKRRFSNSTETYKGCRAKPQRGPEYRAQLTLQGKRRLRFVALDLTGRKTRLFILRRSSGAADASGTGATGNGECVKTRVQSLTMELDAGDWELVAELSPRAGDRGDLLVLIDHAQ